MIDKNIYAEYGFSRLTHQFMILGRLHYKLVHSRLSEHNIPVGAPHLLMLIDHIEGCHHKDLVDNSHLEPATITSALLTMEKEGLIRREPDLLDRRSIRIFLTEKGKEKLQLAINVFRDLEKLYFRNFTEEEIQQTHYLLDKIINNSL